jgi:trans-2,3-dihydro-3-hydroxyanthranilate isomerase
MREFPFMQVDAFTRQPLGGNACAVLFDTEDLDTATMQAVAREQNLSETAFVRSSNTADFAVRYFTPSEEIPMAGHPTIATTWALVESGRVTLAGATTKITLALQIGPLDVEILAEGGKPQQVVMSQLAPEFSTTLPSAEVVDCFGLQSEDLLSGVPIQIVSTGTPQLMVPLRSLEALRRAELRSAAYGQLRNAAGFFSAHLFCVQGITSAGQTFARHFVNPPSLIEDPFTGSATGAMGAYLWYHGLLGQPTFWAEQGHDMGRPGIAMVEVVGARNAIETVKVGGAAVTVLTGTMSF